MMTSDLGRASGALALAASITTVAGCLPEPRDDATDPVVRIVEQSEMQRFGASDSIAIVLDLHVTRDGSVWVLNSVEPFFVGFDPAGREIAAWGSEGEGPDEVRAPLSFLRGASDDAWIYSQGRHAIVRVSQPAGATELDLGGTTLLATRMSSFGRAVRRNRRVDFYRLGGEILFGQRGDEGGGALGLWSATLVAFDPEAGRIRRIVGLADRVAAPSDEYARAEFFMPFPLWGACADGTIPVYDPTLNRILRLDAAGDSVDASALPPARSLALTIETMSAWAYRSAERQRRIEGGPPVDSAAFHQEARQALRQAGDRIAGVFPEFTDLQCTPDANVWLERFDAVAEGRPSGPQWLRIDASGRATEFAFPESFEPLRFTADRAWGFVWGSRDVQHIGWVYIG